MGYRDFCHWVLPARLEMAATAGLEELMIDVRFVPIETWPGEPRKSRRYSPFRGSWKNTLVTDRGEGSFAGKVRVGVDGDAALQGYDHTR